MTIMRMATAPDGDWPRPVDLRRVTVILEYLDARGGHREWAVELQKARQGWASVMVDVRRIIERDEVSLRLDRIKAIKAGGRRIEALAYFEGTFGFQVDQTDGPRSGPPVPPSGPLAGLKVAFTGEFSTFSRASAREIVEGAGGTLVGHGGAAQDVLVVGSGAQVSKRALAGAEKVGCQIIDEANFGRLVGLRG